jgi:hypothetical protein
LPTTARSTKNLSPIRCRADRSANSGRVSRLFVVAIRWRMSSLDADGVDRLRIDEEPMAQEWYRMPAGARYGRRLCRTRSPCE